MAHQRTYEIQGGKAIAGLPVAVEEELYLLVYTLGKPWSKGWWAELCRRIYDTLRDVEGDDRFLVFLPLIQDLLIACHVDHDDRGWYVYCEIAREKLLQELSRR